MTKNAGIIAAWLVSTLASCIRPDKALMQVRLPGKLPQIQFPLAQDLGACSKACECNVLNSCLTLEVPLFGRSAALIECVLAGMPYRIEWQIGNGGGASGSWTTIRISFVAAGQPPHSRSGKA